MRRTGLIAGLCGLFLLIGAAGEQLLHFPLHKFSIAPLEGPSQGPNSTLLMMFLPASGGFSPNVNVVAQQSPGSIDDYIALSQRGFEQAGLKLINSQKLGQDAVVMEYAGTMQNHELHFYAKAILNGKQVLLATGTATEQGWPAAKAQLQSCVDSLRRD